MRLAWQVFNRHSQPHALFALSLMSAAIALGAVAVASRHRTRRACLLLAAANLVAGALWVWYDQPFEGRIFFTVSSRHGLTEADVYAGLPLLIAVLLVARRPRGRSRRRA